MRTLKASGITLMIGVGWFSLPFLIPVAISVFVFLLVRAGLEEDLTDRE